MVALLKGGTQGVKMAVGIATVLIVVLGLEALVDLGLAESFGQNISAQTLLGWLTVPFSALLGLRPEEWQLAGQILGSRFIETEVSAYFALAQAQIADPAPFTQRSVTILTYALCGFVHLASMGIFIGGLTALVPSRANDITVMGGRALWTAFLATVLTGCIAPEHWSWPDSSRTRLRLEEKRRTSVKGAIVFACFTSIDPLLPAARRS